MIRKRRSIEIVKPSLSILLIKYNYPKDSIKIVATNQKINIIFISRRERKKTLSNYINIIRYIQTIFKVSIK